jgi:DNA-binding transcriptional LysR family regulator
MRITLRQLELFAAICQERTVTAAAARVGLSQAATSQALAELENLLERKLFDRHGRRLLLNAAGRSLLPPAIEVLDRVRDIESSGVRQPVNVALYASLTAGNYMLPAIISRFARTHPDYRFHVSIGNTAQVVESLLRFESDAGWIEGIVEDTALMAFPWREDPLVVVAGPDHELAGRKATIEGLAAAAWVLREKGSGTRAVFERAIEGKFRLGRVPAEFAGIEAVKRAVVAGAGLSCMSGSAVAAEVRSGQLRRVYVPWLDLRRQITVLLHRDKYRDAGLSAFLRYCGVPRLHYRSGSSSTDHPA